MILIFQQKIRTASNPSSRVSIASIHPEVQSFPTADTTNLCPLFFAFQPSPTPNPIQRRLSGKPLLSDSTVTRPPRHHPAVCPAQSRDCRKDRFLDPTSTLPTGLANSSDRFKQHLWDRPSIPDRSESSKSAAHTTLSPISSPCRPRLPEP